MLEMVEIIENHSVNNYISDQLKLIKKNNINTTSILIKLYNLIYKDYICTFTSGEMTIRLDKKRNIIDTKKSIIIIIKSLVPKNIDISFLFKFFSNDRELILRVKRNIK